MTRPPIRPGDEWDLTNGGDERDDEYDDEYDEPDDEERDDERRDDELLERADDDEARYEELRGAE